MVPEHWEEYYARSNRSVQRGLHVTPKSVRSHPSFVFSGYTDAPKEILQTESKQDTNQASLQDDEGIKYELDLSRKI